MPHHLLTLPSIVSVSNSKIHTLNCSAIPHLSPSLGCSVNSSSLTKICFVVWSQTFTVALVNWVVLLQEECLCTTLHLDSQKRMGKSFEMLKGRIFFQEMYLDHTANFSQAGYGKKTFNQKDISENVHTSKKCIFA